MTDGRAAVLKAPLYPRLLAVSEVPSPLQHFETSPRCGGKRTVDEACANPGLDPEAVLGELEAFDAEAEAQPDAVRPADLTMTELADDIERTHHAYLREELPRLGDPRLARCPTWCNIP